MIIKSNIRDYIVEMNDDFSFLDNLLKKENAIYVIDKKVYGLYKKLFNDILEDKLILIDATEENKNIDTALMICEKITELSAKRNTTLISIGGGIIQDITGFVANITYRGIHWFFIPTTLLAACDSCIGGKTSLNYKKFKNLLGTFYPPEHIFICPKFFDTLSDKDYKSGLGEVVKFNLMKGEEGLTNISDNLHYLLLRKHDVINRFVKESLRYKKTFIEIDEFDNGERIKLNFAHTFGHSIEVVTKYAIPHGTAVAIGMVMANYVSYKRGFISLDALKKMEKNLLEIIDIDYKLLDSPIDNYLSAIRKDKKQINNQLTAVLIQKYGNKAELTIVHNLQEKEVAESIVYFNNLYREKNNEN